MNRRIPLIVAGLLLGLLAVTPLSAQSKNSSDSLGKAQVNRIINDVFTVEDIRKDKPRIHPSNEGEVIGQYHALRTAEQSRAELKFEDGSIARVGSDAFFSFASNSRDVQMGKGTALFQVPKNSEETNIQTATATASLTGTTVMVNQQPDRHVKTAVIEGSVDVSMPDRAGESRTLNAGQMIVMPTDAERLPEPVDVDLQELVSTSGLINNFDEEEDEEESTDESQETDETSDESESEGASQEEGTNEGTDSTNSPDNESEDQDQSLEAVSSEPTGGDEQDDGGSGLDIEQMSEGIDQQQEEIESGELEETNMVIQGEGTDLTIAEEENETDLTSELTQEDAVEESNDSDRTLTMDGQTNIYLGTGDGDPPTAAGKNGVIFTPDSDVDLQTADLSGELVDQFISSIAEGRNTARFNFDEITVTGQPDVDPTSEIFDIAFVSKSTLELDSESLKDMSGFESLSLVSQADDYSWDIPKITSQDANVGILGNGVSTSINLSDVSLPGLRYVALSSGNMNAADQAISTGRLRLGSITGSVNLDGSVASAADLGFRSDRTSKPSINITNSTQLRLLSSDGEIGLVSKGGDIKIKSSEAGFYDNGFYNDQAGNIYIDTQNPDVDGLISLNDSNLMAAAVRARAHGPEGQLLIDGSTIKANQIMQLYSSGSNGMVRFTGSSELAGQATKEIAGKTVRVDPGVNVAVTGNTYLTVYSDNMKFSSAGVNGTCDGDPCGSFTDGTSTTIALDKFPFGDRPNFDDSSSDGSTN